jgi:hypothetical protein
MKTSRIADEDSVSKEIKYIHTYIHTFKTFNGPILLETLVATSSLVVILLNNSVYR